MKTFLTGIAALLCVSAFPWLAPSRSGRPPAVDGAPERRFTIQKLADGVYAAIRSEPVGFGVDANNLFIIDADGVVVVDTNFGPSSTREVLAALRQLTTRPVRFVVNTHWHDDHILGNQVYREQFPGVQFIAHAKTKDYLPGKGVEARKQMMTGAPAFANDLRAIVKSGKSPLGGDLTEEERISHESDIALVDRYMADSPSFDIVLPTIVVNDNYTLKRPGRTIEIRHIGGGHTAGDIVVYLPAERILATGDLVVAPVPLVGSDQSHMADWIAALDRIVALAPATIVPGHGPVMHDTAYARLMADTFRAITQQVNAAAARGETLEQIRKSVNLDAFRDRFTGGSRLKNMIFANYVTGPAVAAAYREAEHKGPSGNNCAILAADASRLAALLVGHMRPACSLLAPCDPGASAPRNDALISGRALRVKIQGPWGQRAFDDD